MNRPAVVLAHGVAKRWGSTQALAGVDLRLDGGVTTLLGPNGAGKTTMLRCLATATVPDAGQILVDGLDVGERSDRTEIRRRLGYLPQEPRFSPKATVYEVVDYLAILKEHHDRSRRHREVVRVLRLVGLDDRLDARTAALSTGMRRRLGVAQALIGSPSLLLLDEPATALDPEERLSLREQISGLGASSTVVVSTHLTDEAAAISATVVVLVDGAVCFVGPPVALAAAAAGRVWVAPTAPVGVVRSWRLPDGSYRVVGEPPTGVPLVEPTLEDGYLWLLGTTRPAGTRR
ncbi:MAG: ATP-binding cassette domain-containing protein [Acidimicrobiia bacterium]|nr:ATP-binding cassette domain-containing protein [Acidimicrobiia bacterium]